MPGNQIYKSAESLNAALSTLPENAFTVAFLSAIQMFPRMNGSIPWQIIWGETALPPLELKLLKAKINVALIPRNFRL